MLLGARWNPKSSARCPLQADQKTEGLRHDTHAGGRKILISRMRHGVKSGPVSWALAVEPGHALAVESGHAEPAERDVGMKAF